MSVTVIRHRGGGMDDDGNPVPGADTPLTAKAVAPGANPDMIDRGRDGQRVECTVYFEPEVDLTGADELTVAGQRYRLAVEPWSSPWSSRTGTVALCSRGEG
ncbi:hypothetical protein ACIBG0_40125 [Nocardia sp. NPDC050630]|uniref:hypothetical protein n=1 Tax=Nocardia sp. NPDC050630 TaxID=3364321 RepID=UPI003799169C